MKTLWPVLVGVGVALSGAVAGAQSQKEIQLDIQSEALADALNEWAQAAGFRLIGPASATRHLRSPRLQGTFTPRDALDRLLTGTSLTYEFVDEGTVAILERPSTTSVAPVGAQAENHALRLAAAQGEARPIGGAGPSSDVREPDTDKQRTTQPLEEVIVTAQKRAEQLIDVPMSITAISGSDLTTAGIENALDLSYAVPSLAVAQTGPGRQVIVIRGIGSVRGSSSLTGVYLDEMPVTGAQDGFIAAYPDVRTIDLERVEVLKGPQGTLFGEGASGGVIRFITKDPDLSRLGGEMSTQLYSTADGGWSEAVTGIVNIPLADDVFGIRVAGMYENTSGWIDQPSIGREDINDSEVKHARVKALYMPTPEFRIMGTAEIHRNEGGGSNIVNQEPREDSNFLQAFDRNAPTNYVDDYDLFNLAMTYDFGFAELLSSTSYAELDSSQSFTQLVDAVPRPFLEILIRDYQLHASIFSQEFRLTSAAPGRFNWTLGASYKDADLTSGFGPAGGDQILFGGAFSVTRANAGIEPTGTSESWAGFADASFELSKVIEVGGGLRYFVDERESFDQAASPRVVLADEFDKTTYRVYVKVKPTDDWNIYANVATGFRSGGFNNPTFVRRGAPPSYEPETTLFYELGTKLSLLDGRLRLDSAVFYGEFQGMQDAITVRSPVDGNLLQFTTNAQDAELKGVEWDIRWAATGQLELTLAGDVTDSEITKVDSSNIQSGFLVGDPVNLVPKYSVSASADYSFQWSDSVPGYFLLSFDRQGKSYYTARNIASLTLAPQGVKPVLEFLNASVGAEWNGWKWSLFGKNLLDERGALNPTETGWTAQARPRTIGVGISKTF